MDKSLIFSIFDMSALAVFLLMSSVTDKKSRIIPNKYIIVFFLIRTLLIAIRSAFTGNLADISIRSLLGLLLGVTVTGAAALISKKGLGAGDVKMFALVGYFTGCAGVLDILIYSTFFCALTGLALVVLKKCSMKSFLPMAPFTFAGTAVYIVLGVK